MPSRTARDITPEGLHHFHPFRFMAKPVISPRQESALATASALATELKERFNASKVMLFGSATRADFSPWSDIDLAVWGISSSDYYKAVAYASGFSSVFKVDLVDAEDCSQSLLQHITQNGIVL